MSVTRAILAAIVAALLGSAYGCSLLFSTDGWSRGTDDANKPNAAGTGEGGVPPKIVDRPGGGQCFCAAQPAGWEGPVSVWRGDGAAPECSGTYAAQVADAHDDLDAPAPACSCTCSTEGASCPSTFTVEIFGDKGCGGTKCDTVTLTAGTCTNVQANCVFANAVRAAPAVHGSCTPIPSTVVPKATWKTKVRMCQLPAPPTPETCDAPGLCVPIPTAPMALRPCVYASGDLACPAGAYSVKQVVYGDFHDDRGCSPCVCGGLRGNCTASLKASCTSSPAQVTIPTNCAAIDDPDGIALAALATPADVVCPADGGAPLGTATGTSPTTLCCLP